MKHLCGLYCLVVTLCVALITTAASAAVPIVMSHQGRLLDGSDQPLNGVYTLTYSIFDDSAGGAQLWTENHVGVEVVDGLFTVELGSVVPLSPDILSGSGGGAGGATVQRYLQIQVAGQPAISPRTRLLASPYAVASSRVSGDVETAPGEMTINDGSHDRAIVKSLGSVSYLGTWDVTNRCSSRLYTDTDSAGLSLGIDDRDLLGLRVNTGINEPLPYTTLHLSDVSEKGLSSLTCTADSVVESKSFQVNPTTVHEIKEDCDDTDARVGVSVHATGSWSGGASISSTRNVSSDIDCDVDPNGSGHAERNMRVRINELESRLALGSDLDDDGLSDLEVRGVTGQDSALLTITSQNAAQRKGEANIGAVLNGSTVIGCASYSDASGVPSTGSTMTSNDLGASSTTSSNKGHYYVVTNASADPVDGAALRVGADTSANGHPERSVWQKVDNSQAASAVETDVDDDGTPDIGCSMESKGTRAELKTYFETGDIPTQGRSHITQSVDADSAITEIQTRLNGLPPGEPVIGTLSLRTDVTKSDIGLGNVTDVSNIELISSSGPLPGGQPSSTFRMGRPAVNQALFVIDQGGVNMEASSSGRNIGLHVSDVSGQCSLAMVDATSGTSDTTIVIDGSLKRFGIGVSQPDSPIQHSSGARLTDAGDWTNASDENLKENFTRVDGAEILNEIDALPISRWNYKVQSSDVTHIGPTAQDFKKVFGVGSDGKTISTIDPSGIALAAIKELSKQNRTLAEQNRDLQEQNELLKKQMDDLARKVDRLLSGK